MSDTCIVCLGDLSTGPDQSAALSRTLTNPGTGAQVSTNDNAAAIFPSLELGGDSDNINELIAHIPSCGHDLHNACLTPWVERANSCPICRASFNLVELKHYVGGNVVSSYLVEDRIQVAELDPSMFLEPPDEDDEDQPCQECGEDDNEDVLMYCDGCDKLWHTYCTGLQEVPRGAWFCDNCANRRDQRPVGRAAHRPVRRRTRGQQRRARGQHDVQESDWHEVWQTVFGSLGLDLDFPNDEDGAPATAMRRHRAQVEASRRAHHAWLSRVRVAELQGAGHRFRENEDAILNGTTVRRPRPTPPEETQEEKDMWSAFDAARAATPETGPSRKRKRTPGSKSKTVSPVPCKDEAAPVTVKRRRVSRSADVDISRAPRRPDLAPLLGASSTPRQQKEEERPQQQLPPPPPPPPPPVENGAPSFLQSLLLEVEESSGSRGGLPLHRPSPRNAGTPAAESHSPRPSSPAISPTASNHSSPRAMSATPPPIPSGLRPSSPTGLSSSIQPVYPLTDFSPSHPNPDPKKDTTEPHPTKLLSRIPVSSSLARPQPKRHRSLGTDQNSPSDSDDPGPHSSPIRAAMSFTAKSDVQKLVSAALKPLYVDQKISKDEYTNINRDVSRMLYERIGDFESLDVEGKAKWERIAGDEVNKAVGALRALG